MDLIWKVGARAKEILVQKEEPKKVQDENKTDNSSDALEASVTPHPSVETKEVQQTVSETAAKNDDEVHSDKSSTPEYDDKEFTAPPPEPKEADRNLMTGLSSGDIKDVSLKAVESAKSIGSFLFGVANKTGKSISETAKQLKQTVEQNSILGDFNKEQETFVNNKVSKTNDLGLPPWVGVDDEENVKQQILSLSSDKRNFLRSPPSGVMFEFNFDDMYPVAMVMLKEDPALEKMRFDLVPKLVSEENFWRNYFYRVSLLKQSTRLSSMSHQKSSSGDSATWSSKKSMSDDSAKEMKSQPSKAKPNQTGLSDSPNQEFVSDDFQGSRISEKEIKDGMKLLGVADKSSKDDEWEKEIQQELQEYEVVAQDHNDEDDVAWENEIDQMLGRDKVTDVV